jgi:hypothetical protein
LKILSSILRLYTYSYHLLLCLFLLALGIVASIGDQHNLLLPMLPWKGAELTRWLLILGVAGLVSALLAITGIFRYLFPVWCLVAAVLMIRGFFLSQYVYDGPSHFQRVVWLVSGAIAAFLASLPLLRPKRRSG